MPDPNRTQRPWRPPLNANELLLIAAICCVIGLTAWIDRGHVYWNNPWDSFVDIVRQVALLGIFALGACVVIISGGIDLSAGSMIAFSGTICGTILVFLAPDVMNQGGGSGEEVPVLAAWQIAVAIGGTALVGFLVGSLHAWLITSVGLPPFIATLATLVGLRSLARAICETATEAMTGQPSTQINISDEGFLYLAQSIWIPCVVFVVLALAIWLLLSRTVVGRHLYALGGNEQAARLSGIQTERIKWLAYSISAMTASIAGVFYFSQISTAEPQTLGLGEELNAIAAAVVGGCSLQGGIGTVPGAVLGVIFLRCVVDGIAKIIKTGSDVYEGLIVGVVVVVAVAFSQLRQRSGSRKRFFPGALGWVAVLTLGLLGGTLVLVMTEPRYGLFAGIAALALLGAVKLAGDLKRN
jgi:ribose/xylose/arabinose/galactoside ABC-type transport system permease subunit